MKLVWGGPKRGASVKFREEVMGAAFLWNTLGGWVRSEMRLRSRRSACLALEKRMRSVRLFWRRLPGDRVVPGTSFRREPSGAKRLTMLEEAAGSQESAVFRPSWFTRKHKRWFDGSFLFFSEKKKKKASLYPLSCVFYFIKTGLKRHWKCGNQDRKSRSLRYNRYFAVNGFVMNGLH